jgi:hypothetical protein
MTFSHKSAKFSAVTFPVCPGRLRFFAGFRFGVEVEGADGAGTPVSDLSFAAEILSPFTGNIVTDHRYFLKELALFHCSASRKLRPWLL